MTTQNQILLIDMQERKAAKTLSAILFVFIGKHYLV